VEGGLMPTEVTGLVYADVEVFLTDGLEAKGYASTLPAQPEAKPMPLINPGPVTDAALQNLSPGPIVFATVGNGAGLTLEQTYDQVFITIRAIGPQGDFEAAERLALDIDRLFLAINSNTDFGKTEDRAGTRVLYVTRSGGGPQLIDYDRSDRYHFQTTYVARSATGL
jgi:hypothetical protein